MSVYYKQFGDAAAKAGGGKFTADHAVALKTQKALVHGATGTKTRMDANTPLGIFKLIKPVKLDKLVKLVRFVKI